MDSPTDMQPRNPRSPNTEAGLQADTPGREKPKLHVTRQQTRLAQPGPQHQIELYPKPETMNPIKPELVEGLGFECESRKPKLGLGCVPVRVKGLALHGLRGLGC